MFCSECGSSFGETTLGCPACWRASGAERRPAAPAGAPEGTVEMPLTPAVRRCIPLMPRHWVATLCVALGAILAAIPLLFLGLYMLRLVPGEDVSLNARGGVVALAAGLFPLSGGLTFLYMYLHVLCPRLLDRWPPAYLRTIGAIRYVGKQPPESEVAHTLALAGRYFGVGDGWSWALRARLGGLRWGTLDYTRHKRIVLEIRGADGRTVYRHPEYRPE